MDSLYIGLAVGAGLAVLYKIVDALTAYWYRQRHPPVYQSSPQTQALLREIGERNQRIVAMLDNLPMARRRRR